MGQHNSAQNELDRIDMQRDRDNRAGQSLISNVFDRSAVPQQIARPGDERGGLFTGIAGRRRIKEQQELNNRLAREQVGIEDRIGDDLFTASEIRPEQFESVEAAAAVNRLLDNPDTRQAAIDMIDQSRARNAALNIPPPTQREIATQANDVGLQILRMRDNVQQPLDAQQTAGANIIRNLSRATGWGDIGGTFGFFKFIDPGSRVTEGEISLSAEASPFAQSALAIFNRVGGESGLFTPPVRAELAQLVGSQIGFIGERMQKNHALFNDKLGAMLSGAFEAGIPQAQEVSRSPFFNPDFQIPEFERKTSLSEGLFGSATTEAGADDKQNLADRLEAQ